MPEMVKKTKCGGVEKNRRGVYAGEGKEDEMQGGGGCENNLKVGEGYAGEGTEDKMQGGGGGGCCGKKLGGYRRG